MTEPASGDRPADRQLEEVPCDYCGQWDADRLYTGRDRLHGLPGEFHVVVCRRCGLARTNPRPVAESLAETYPSDYGPHEAAPGSFASPSGALRWLLVNYRGYPLGRPAPPIARALAWPWAAMRLTRRRLLRFVRWTDDGQLLDVGCGTGRYVAQMAAVGWQAEGIDPSASAVAAGRRAGLAIQEGTLPGTDLPEASFDAVTMWHALEHVPSPAATLLEVRRVLRPGGRFYLTVPRLDSLMARWLGADWIGLDMPRHLTHFTERTLRRHVSAAGLEVKAVRALRMTGAARTTCRLRGEAGGRWLDRRLGRSRLLLGLAGYAAAVVGRSDAMFLSARRADQMAAFAGKTGR